MRYPILCLFLLAACSGESSTDSPEFITVGSASDPQGDALVGLDLRRAQVGVMEDSVHFRFEFASGNAIGDSTGISVYVDTDGDVNTGFILDEEVGADALYYMQTNGELTYAVWDNGLWEEVNAWLNTTADGNVVRASVARPNFDADNHVWFRARALRVRGGDAVISDYIRNQDLPAIAVE